ncbi:MAG: hypothetical protein Q9191_000473 [Dirinaria sp. TL-2023a]
MLSARLSGAQWIFAITLLLLAGVARSQNTASSNGSTVPCYDFDGSIVEGDSPCNPDLGRGITLNSQDNTFCCQADLDQPCYPDPKVKSLDLGTPLTTVGVTGAPTTSHTSSTTQTTTTSSKKAKATSSESQLAVTSSKQKASASTTAGAAAVAENTTPPQTTNTATASPKSGGLSGGAIAGIVIGVVVAVAAVVAGLFFLRTRSRRQGGVSGGQYKSELPARSAQAAPEKGYYAPADRRGDGGTPELDDPNNPRRIPELDDPSNPRAHGELPA